jgi:hypothetical protein
MDSSPFGDNDSSNGGAGDEDCGEGKGFHWEFFAFRCPRQKVITAMTPM